MVRFYGQHDPGVWAWGVSSFSRAGLVFEVTIDMGSGECTCECEHYRIRLRKLHPSLLEGCKHVRAVRLAAKRRLHESA